MAELRTRVVSSRRLQHELLIWFNEQCAHQGLIMPWVVTGKKTVQLIAL
jgi:hypothetical protein